MTDLVEKSVLIFQYAFFLAGAVRLELTARGFGELIPTSKITSIFKVFVIVENISADISPTLVKTKILNVAKTR